MFSFSSKSKIDRFTEQPVSFKEKFLSKKARFKEFVKTKVFNRTPSPPLIEFSEEYLFDCYAPFDLEAQIKRDPALTILSRKVKNKCYSIRDYKRKVFNGSARTFFKDKASLWAGWSTDSEIPVSNEYTAAYPSPVNSSDDTLPVLAPIDAFSILAATETAETDYQYLANDCYVHSNRGVENAAAISVNAKCSEVDLRNFTDSQDERFVPMQEAFEKSVSMEEQFFADISTDNIGLKPAETINATDIGSFFKDASNIDTWKSTVLKPITNVVNNNNNNIVIKNVTFKDSNHDLTFKSDDHIVVATHEDSLGAISIDVIAATNSIDPGVVVNHTYSDDDSIDYLTSLRRTHEENHDTTDNNSAFVIEGFQESKTKIHEIDETPADATAEEDSYDRRTNNELVGNSGSLRKFGNLHTDADDTTSFLDSTISDIAADEDVFSFEEVEDQEEESTKSDSNGVRTHMLNSLPAISEDDAEGLKASSDTSEVTETCPTTQFNCNILNNKDPQNRSTDLSHSIIIANDSQYLSPCRSQNSLVIDILEEDSCAEETSFKYSDKGQETGDNCSANSCIRVNDNKLNLEESENSILIIQEECQFTHVTKASQSISSHNVENSLKRQGSDIEKSDSTDGETNIKNPLLKRQRVSSEETVLDEGYYSVQAPNSNEIFSKKISEEVTIVDNLENSKFNLEKKKTGGSSYRKTNENHLNEDVCNYSEDLLGEQVVETSCEEFKNLKSRFSDVDNNESCSGVKDHCSQGSVDVGSKSVLQCGATIEESIISTNALKNESVRDLPSNFEVKNVSDLSNLDSNTNSLENSFKDQCKFGIDIVKSFIKSSKVNESNTEIDESVESLLDIEEQSDYEYFLVPTFRGELKNKISLSSFISSEKENSIRVNSKIFNKTFQCVKRPISFRNKTFYENELEAGPDYDELPEFSDFGSDIESGSISMPSKGSIRFDNKSYVCVFDKNKAVDSSNSKNEVSTISSSTGTSDCSLSLNNCSGRLFNPEKRSILKKKISDKIFQEANRMVSCDNIGIDSFLKMLDKGEDERASDMDSISTKKHMQLRNYFDNFVNKNEDMNSSIYEQFERCIEATADNIGRPIYDYDCLNGKERELIDEMI
ncbi:hypothetical protein B1J92_H09922g [Nakaseomyces glabratus]|nr:hypothetical protein B1J91_H09922g [Nakaseomyces glabratus]OXB48400.1 hypothetical protein B1J92_H09922g [Nakaseomyces glabratus]